MSQVKIVDEPGKSIQEIVNSTADRLELGDRDDLKQQLLEQLLIFVVDYSWQTYEVGFNAGKKEGR
jgi:hypothetical protein